MQAFGKQPRRHPKGIEGWSAEGSGKDRSKLGIVAAGGGLVR